MLMSKSFVKRKKVKRLRQQIARASNEIFRRTQNRIATAIERGLLNELKRLMGVADTMAGMLKQYKELD